MRFLASLVVAVTLARCADLTLPDLSGTPQSLEHYRGRLVILNYWATWCVPCREEMPLLNRIHLRYRQHGVVVIGASVDDPSTQPAIRPFVEQLRISFPIWTGATIAHMQQFELGAALPATAIVDRDGQVAFRIIGPLKQKDLVRRIDYLLSGRGGVPEQRIDTHEDEEEDHTHAAPSVEGASMVPS